MHKRQFWFCFLLFNIIFSQAKDLEIVGPDQSEVMEYMESSKGAVGAMMFANNEKMSYFKSGILDDSIILYSKI